MKLESIIKKYKRMILPGLVAFTIPFVACRYSNNYDYHYNIPQEEVQQCDDGIDNDGDGLTDYEDLGCYDSNGYYNPIDNKENNEVLNNPPQIDSINIAPDSPTMNDVLTCNVAASDLDGDPVNIDYSWITTGAYDLSGFKNNTLDMNVISGESDGDVITCTAIPNDGIENGLSNFDSVNVTDKEYLPDVNTMALYHFNEPSGAIAYDSSANGNNGNINGPTRTIGKFENALAFDGNGVAVPNSSSLTVTGTGLTLEAYIKPYIINKDQSIFDKQYIGGYQMEIMDNNKICLTMEMSPYAGVNVCTTNPVIEKDVWQHVAFTYDGSNIKFYKNKKLVESWPETRSIGGTGYPLGIGYDVYAPAGRYFTGELDELRVSNIARDF